MAWVTAVIGVVGLVQGMAWLGGGSSTGRRRRTQGAVLAPAGLLLFGLSALHLLVPAFFG